VTAMQSYTQNVMIMGTVKRIDPGRCCFEVKLRSGDVITCNVHGDDRTQFAVLTNIDGLNRDRIPAPPRFNDKDMREKLAKYLQPETLVVVDGVYQENGDRQWFDAVQVCLLHSTTGRYLFEDTHWWLDQITQLADTWLKNLFGENLDFQVSDFSKSYRTNLNITGLNDPGGDPVQEMATLSRLIYGFSSAYLLTGARRFFLAAQMGVEYQREAFRSLSHDNKYAFWAFGKRNGKVIIASENDDDRGTIPLYEQIYALAGLAQYFRITGDWEVLEDIRRTVETFEDYYLDDKSKDPTRPGYGGYFSHLDYATLRPDVESLAHNQSRKNWNSIGDHIPAYLINIILALAPLPAPRALELEPFLETLKQMLDRVTDLILDKFPDPDPAVPYVNERFFADWTPDHQWRWQQDRAIVGHNLKIAWNLTRAANYYETEGNHDKARCLLERARKLGDAMEFAGIDRIRGGCYDAVERHPKDSRPIEFAWENTKDFWQQEQAVLAYLILYGRTQEQNYLGLAREMAAFWNLFFLDRDRGGVYFRTMENGLPYIQGVYGTKASHSMSGYHAFELNYLAHLYIRSYVPLPDSKSHGCFTLYFRPNRTSGFRSINVLPDFFPPGKIKLHEVKVNGVCRYVPDPGSFQVPLEESDREVELAVTFCPSVA
jgi:mannose/cellobiose epimerase-like protein (N-acyl-D-glucosamine 2-epimerase family)